MPVEPISQAAPARTPAIFPHRQRIHVADATAIEIARGRMMNGMSAAPQIVRRQRDHADETADPIVRTPVGKERAVTAVVLDKEQAEEKAGGRRSDEE